jgi:hypothetical protein
MCYMYGLITRCARGLTPTSRLGCQIVLNQDTDGIKVTLPKATRNFYVDGHKPKPHVREYSCTISTSLNHMFTQ